MSRISLILDAADAPAYDAVQDRHLFVILGIRAKNSSSLNNPVLSKICHGLWEGIGRALKDEVVTVHHHRYFITLSVEATREGPACDKADSLELLGVFILSAFRRWSHTIQPIIEFPTPALPPTLRRELDKGVDIGIH